MAEEKRYTINDINKLIFFEIIFQNYFRPAWDQANVVDVESFKLPSIFILWLKIFVRLFSGIAIALIIFFSAIVQFVGFSILTGKFYCKIFPIGKQHR